MEEQTFYKRGNVLVSSSRFVVDGQTYVMRNVSSVKAGQTPGSKKEANIVGLLALPFFFAGEAGLWVVVLLLLFFLHLRYQVKPLYTVVLMTTAGENQALTSTDKQYVDAVVKALNEAIVSRG